MSSDALFNYANFQKPPFKNPRSATANVHEYIITDYLGCTTVSNCTERKIQLTFSCLATLH